MEADNKRVPDASVVLSSSHSTKVSLDAVKRGRAGLDKRRQAMLDRVPDSGNWERFDVGFLEMIDIAYLTAKTGHEFAILRGRREDILFHGTSTQCDVMKEEKLESEIIAKRYRLYGHSHPGEPFPDPSADDRAFLRYIGQERSKLISGMTGICIDFGQVL